MSNLRKDNYAVATTEYGNVYGKVLSVSKADDAVVLATPAGESARVALSNTSKITIKEYKDNATQTAATFDAADAEVGAAPEVKESVGIRPGGARKPGPKGTGKKADALAAYAQLVVDGVAPSRKTVIGVFTTEVGLSKAGANTYYQNIKSGKWSA